MFGSMDHLKTFIDHLIDVDHSIEVGVNRCTAGSNTFVYFRAPDGNRIELSAEMVTLDDATETKVDVPEYEALTAWGGIEVPETFKDGT